MKRAEGIGPRAERSMPSRWQRLLAGALAAGAIVAILNPADTARAADYPGQDEISAAQDAAADAAASVSQLDGAIASLESALQDAQVSQAMAGERYVQALDASTTAQAELEAANKRADDADAALDAARKNLGSLAQAAYRGGGSLGSIEAITSAEGFEDVITRSEAMNRASSEADVTLQQVSAAELVSTTMRARAEDAAATAQAAEALAADALADAEASADAAQRAVDEAAATQAELLDRLAELNNTSVQLEQQRQEGLAADRAEREQERFEEEQAATPPPPSGGDGGNTGGNGGGGGGNTGGGGGNTGGGGGTTPDPEPTTTTDPDPVVTPDPEETTDPEPEPTPPPASTWKSSAAQGSQAVTKGRSLIGSSYQWGGNGPKYDCSGLTKASWAAAGIYLPSSSRSQYAAVTKIPYSQLRPGDLIFWGSGKNASAMHHVALYIGGGMVVEAASGGDGKAGIRQYNNWMTRDMMPYAGRP